MKVRSVILAYVSAAFLAATAMNHGTAFANSSANYPELVRQAYQDMQQGDAVKAIGEFTQAIDSGTLEPEVAVNALLNRALAYQQTNAHDNAVADYTTALKMNVMEPNLRATALYNRGISQQKLNQLAQAVEDFTGALLLNPQFSQAFYNRANALRDSGQLLFALSDYERAIRYNYPDLSRVYLGTGTTYLALRRPIDAQKAFQEALHLNPSLGEARAQLVMLGDQFAKAGDEASQVDPILTAAVSPLAGGTTAVKQEMPKAVELPTELAAVIEGHGGGSAPQKKVITERLADAVAGNTDSGTESVAPSGSENIVVADVPAIPAVSKTKATAKVAASEPEKAVEQIADQEATASVDPAPVVAEVQSGWVVQIASATSEEGAWSSWKKISTKNKMLTNERPNVVRADLGTKGIYYRVRLGGFGSQDEAQAKCKKLKSSGVSCYISKAG